MAIKYLALSHTHPDHTGNANLFTAATLYMQEPEYDAAFGPDAAKYNFNPATYDKLRGNPVVKLHGDHDVFSDGSVVIKSTPGHTIGHQALLVRLPKTGPVLLSGDLVHFEDNWVNKRVPARNFDREQSLRTMEAIGAFLAETKAPRRPRTSSRGVEFRAPHPRARRRGRNTSPGVAPGGPRAASV